MQAGYTPLPASIDMVRAFSQGYTPPSNTGSQITTKAVPDLVQDRLQARDMFFNDERANFPMDDDEVLGLLNRLSARKWDADLLIRQQYMKKVLQAKHSPVPAIDPLATSGTPSNRPASANSIVHQQAPSPRGGTSFAPQLKGLAAAPVPAASASATRKLAAIVSEIAAERQMLSISHSTEPRHALMRAESKPHSEAPSPLKGPKVAPLLTGLTVAPKPLATVSQLAAESLKPSSKPEGTNSRTPVRTETNPDPETAPAPASAPAVSPENEPGFEVFFARMAPRLHEMEPSASNEVIRAKLLKQWTRMEAKHRADYAPVSPQSNNTPASGRFDPAPPSKKLTPGSIRGRVASSGSPGSAHAPRIGTLIKRERVLIKRGVLPRCKGEGC